MAETVIDTNSLGQVLHQARQEQWNNPVPNRVPTSLMLAINSLRRKDGSFWERDATNLLNLLDDNPGVRRVFSATEPNLIAFAIRQARM